MGIITSIRQNVGLLVGLIAVAILSFLLMDIFSGPGGRGQSVNVAEINGTPVSAQEYQQITNQALANAQRMQPNMDNATRLRVQEQAWQQYLRDKLAQTEYDELGLAVNGAELMDLFTGKNPHPSVKNEPTFQNPTTKQFDPELLKNYVRSFNSGDLPAEETAQRRTVWAQFEKGIAETQLRQKYTDLIKKGIYVPKWQAQMVNENQNFKSTFDYVFVPYTTVDDSQIAFSDSDLKQYLNANKEKFKQKEAVSVKFVAFPVKPSDADKKKAETYVNGLLGEFQSTIDDSTFITRNSDTPFSKGYFTKAELNGKGYDGESIMNAPLKTLLPVASVDNKYAAIKVLDRATVPDSVKVRHILRRVDAGTDAAKAKATIDSIFTAISSKQTTFDEAAKAISQDGSASKGGDLGWVKKGMMVAPFEETIFYGKGKGVLQKVMTQFGWHLVEVTETGIPQAAAKIAVLSRDIAVSTETTGAIYAQANQFAGTNRTQEAFDKAATAANLTVQNAADLKKGDYMIPGLGANESIIAWAFKNPVGTVSNVYEVEDKYAVAVITDKKEEGYATLDNVRAQIETEVKKEKKAEKILEQYKGKAGSVQDIATALGQTVRSVQEVSFDAPTVAGLGREPKVQAAAAILEQGKTSKPIVGDQGVYVIEIKERKTTPSEMDYSPIQFNEANSQRGRVDFSVFEALKNAAKITDTRYDVFR